MTDWKIVSLIITGIVAILIAVIIVISTAPPALVGNNSHGLKYDTGAISNTTEYSFTPILYTIRNKSFFESKEKLIGTLTVVQDTSGTKTSYYCTKPYECKVTGSTPITIIYNGETFTQVAHAPNYIGAEGFTLLAIFFGLFVLIGYELLSDEKL